MYREHNFVHELNSQIPEANVAKLPVRLCGRWAESVELRKIETVCLVVVCELARKGSEIMRVIAEVDAGEARMEKV